MKCTCSENSGGRWGCPMHSIFESQQVKSTPLEPEDVIRAKLWELETRIAALERTQHVGTKDE